MSARTLVACAAACSVAVALPSTRLPAAPPPEDASALTRWLEEDPSGERFWQALSSASPDQGSTASAREGPLVRFLLGQIPPERFEQRLEVEPALADGARALLALALDGSDPSHLEAASAYVASAARSRSQRVGARARRWTDEELHSLLDLAFVDLRRFVADPIFRGRVLAILPRVWDPRSAAEELRDRLLYAINHVPGVDFFASEKIELGWGAADRASAQRELDYSPSSALHADDVTATIMASVYSLPSDFVTPEAAARLLGSIQRASERTLVALVDLPMRERLAGDASLDQVLFLETYGRGYTPWPRDPFTLVGRSDGGAAVLVRPNRQLGREEDNFLGLELVQGIPEWLDARWGGLTWSRAPAPFHNGQVILTPRHAWISLHTLEQRVLELLGLERVPEASFARKEGWLRYLAAARRASAELASLYAREIAFVHPLGEEREGEDLEALIEAIAGGAGFDLDSLVTFLEPPGAHRPSALVGDVSGRGSALLGSMSSDELERFRAGFELAPRSEELRRALLQAQGSPRAAGLARFLDLVADALAARGLEVERLPLFLVPVALLSQRDELEHPDFLVTWNNVVPEVREGVARAEGFESLSSSGDREAREVFERAGYRLDLLPPLIRSIILNGGYRCASQHLRAR